ncbi:hypothetical protein SAMN05428967_3367 [Phyllobacterium sp. YR620]|uniref:hypothetical protein n=1 Tax=Phyllobacterium sp. YR620 TaxID=1881066 RepID=UPI00088CCFD2|nr:hypothetical protein [Phyllobacterium sp. YR620]SDP77315.1 hypothetical protein SAMN05428967_3367 [Phyllobacterium sp. YR620]
MTKRMSHTACFAHFGTTPRNVQWSWSARNEETKTVAVTLWQHEFVKGIYERGPLDPTKRMRPGHPELMDNLKWALNHCEGRIRVIIAIAKDKLAETKQIAECAPTKMVVYVTHLDEMSGAFRLEARL